MKQEQTTNWLYFCTLYCTGGFEVKTKKLENKQMQIAAVTKNNKALNANDKMKGLNILTSSN